MSAHAPRKFTDITFDEVQALFNVPIKQAALELGICLSLLKKLCRIYNIERWPQRALAKERRKELKQVARVQRAKVRQIPPSRSNCVPDKNPKSQSLELDEADGSTGEAEGEWLHPPASGRAANSNQRDDDPDNSTDSPDPSARADRADTSLSLLLAASEMRDVAAVGATTKPRPQLIESAYRLQQPPAAHLQGMHSQQLKQEHVPYVPPPPVYQQGHAGGGMDHAALQYYSQAAQPPPSYNIPQMAQQLNMQQFAHQQAMMNGMAYMNPHMQYMPSGLMPGMAPPPPPQHMPMMYAPQQQGGGAPWLMANDFRGMYTQQLPGLQQQLHRQMDHMVPAMAPPAGVADYPINVPVPQLAAPPATAAAGAVGVVGSQ